jgi:hypothetical protein
MLQEIYSKQFKEEKSKFIKMKREPPDKPLNAKIIILNQISIIGIYEFQK